MRNKCWWCGKALEDRVTHMEAVMAEGVSTMHLKTLVPECPDHGEKQIADRDRWRGVAEGLVGYVRACVCACKDCMANDECDVYEALREYDKAKEESDGG